MKTEWVDFKRLKEAVDMQMVLDHYSIKNLVKHGDEVRGACPIHKGSERSKNFTVNIRKNAFKCFSKDCGASGNILDLVVGMEECTVREAGIKLQEWFKVGESQISSLKGVGETENKAEVARGIYRDEPGALYEVVIPEAMSDDLESVVVYRELFGDYGYCVAAPENFSRVEGFG